MTETLATTEQSKESKAASVVIGAIGVFDEWYSTQGERFFTETVKAADDALKVMRPTIDTYRAAWAATNKRKPEAFSLADWISWTAATAGREWAPTAHETERLSILWTMATNGHGKATMAKFTALVTMDDTGLWGVCDIASYLAWLPDAAAYDDDGTLNAAIAKQRTDDKVKAKAETLAKARANLTGHTWDTLVPLENMPSVFDRDKRLAALLHDFQAYVAATVATSAKEAEDPDAYVRAVNKSVTDAVKVRKSKVDKALLAEARALVVK